MTSFLDSDMTTKARMNEVRYLYKAEGKGTGEEKELITPVTGTNQDVGVAGSKGRGQRDELVPGLTRNTHTFVKNPYF